MFAIIRKIGLASSILIAPVAVARAGDDDIGDALRNLAAPGEGPTRHPTLVPSGEGPTRHPTLVVPSRARMGQWRPATWPDPERVIGPTHSEQTAFDVAEILGRRWGPRAALEHLDEMGRWWGSNLERAVDPIEREQIKQSLVTLDRMRQRFRDEALAGPPDLVEEADAIEFLHGPEGRPQGPMKGWTLRMARPIAEPLTQAATAGGEEAVENAVQREISLPGMMIGIDAIRRYRDGESAADATLDSIDAGMPWEVAFTAPEALPFLAPISMFTEGVLDHIRPGDDDLPTSATIFRSPIPTPSNRTDRDDDLPLFPPPNPARPGQRIEPMGSRFRAHQSLRDSHLP